MTEIWKHIPDFPPEYEVSSLGRVRRLASTYVSTCGGMFKGKTLTRAKPAKVFALNKLSAHGYQRININALGVFFVHRLVAAAFVANPDDRPFVNHIDGVKTNNRRENLEWVHDSENKNHARAHDLMPRGERCHHTLTDETVDAIRAFAATHDCPQTEIARRFGTCQQNVSSILRGKSRARPTNSRSLVAAHQGAAPTPRSE